MSPVRATLAITAYVSMILGLWLPERRSLPEHRAAEPKARFLVARQDGGVASKFKVELDGKAEPFRTSGGTAESENLTF